ncbi:Protein of unknown function [Bacillus toyonensis]|nr:Protein of unknown function [Bacillus toyonensis]
MDKIEVKLEPPLEPLIEAQTPSTKKKGN